MGRIIGWTIVVALGVVLAGAAHAQDKADRKAKAECKSGCLTDFQDCKSECAPQANTGWGSEGRGYANCDAECHRNYAACTFYCEPE